MSTETDHADGRPLLGLRPPADLAEAGPVTRMAGRPAARATAAPRPSYPVISSGWDAEDDERKARSSDLLAALRAGIVLLVFILALALLLR